MHKILPFIFCIPFCLNILPTAMSITAKQSKVNQLPLFPVGPASIATPPTMVIHAWQIPSNHGQVFSLERFTRVIKRSDNYPIAIHRHDDDTNGDDDNDDGDLKITCYAPYPLVLKTNIIAQKIRQTYQVSEDASNWTLAIKFSFPSAGVVSCSRLDNNKATEQLETRVGIYFDSGLEDKDKCSYCGAFVLPEHNELIPLEWVASNNGMSSRYLAPCRLNTWFDPKSEVPAKPKLFVGGEELSENVTTWSPAEGFTFTFFTNNVPGNVEERNGDRRATEVQSKENVTCRLEEENLDMTFTQPRKLENLSFPTVQAKEDKIWISHRTLRGYEEGAPFEQEIELRIEFCQWLTSCPLRLQDVKRQVSSLGTRATRPQVSQGIVTLAHLPIPLPLDYNFTKFFTGLNHKIYLIPGESQVPDGALIQLAGIPTHQTYKNKTPTVNLTCRVVNFVMSPRVYLKTTMQNGSSTILTAGNALVDDANGQKSGISEFRFELELDAGMNTVECLGLDLYGSGDEAGGKWRTSGSASINVAYSYAPTLRPGTPKNGDKKCMRQGNCLLDCPITGVPAPNIAWAIPGEGTPTKVENPLHLDKVSNSGILPGRYTCFATSPYGQANYTYTVELDNSDLGTGPKVGFAVVVIIFLLLTIAFAVQYHRTKKLLGGLTPEQIREFLRGNQEAADASEDSPERARLMEFAKFISPHLLHINMSEKLGEGCYGIVYGGSYDSHPAAIKTFKMGVTNEQIYDFLVEIKLMAFIGDHDNIVKFFGADISKLRSGQMYMVMERSTGGNLESYLRKQLRNKLSIIKQSKRFAPEVDDLLKTLTQFCFDIASAMEFLEAKKIIHGDLAARNVLLFGENTTRIVAKLTDFGFSRRLNGSSQYTSRSFGQVRLPWAWASPEILTSGTYSTASDVWAFGLTLWEIFSLGRVPFQGSAFNEEFIEAIQKGRRLPRPGFVSDEIFEVLLSCWNLHPSDRPTFNALRSHFAGKQLTHKHVSSLFSCGQDPENGDGRGKDEAVSALSTAAIDTNGNVYL